MSEDADGVTCLLVRWVSFPRAGCGKSACPVRRAGTGNRVKPNRTEATGRKPCQPPPGDSRHCACSRLYSLTAVQLSRAYSDLKQCSVRFRTKCRICRIQSVACASQTTSWDAGTGEHLSLRFLTLPLLWRPFSENTLRCFAEGGSYAPHFPTRTFHDPRGRLRELFEECRERLNLPGAHE